MKYPLLHAFSALLLFFLPQLIFAQAPSLGTTADFVLFSTDGAVTNSGISHVTGNVGTNNGSSTGFGNVNGVMHDADGASAQCAVDLLIAYNQLNSTVPGFFPAPQLGNGQQLFAGVYAISAAASLDPPPSPAATGSRFSSTTESGGSGASGPSAARSSRSAT
jgi:hypothetical protein